MGWTGVQPSAARRCRRRVRAAELGPLGLTGGHSKLIRLVLLTFALFCIGAGYWQFRHPEHTQSLAKKGARYSWQQKLFGSESYLVSVEVNGFVFLAIGCILLFILVADVLIGVLL
jgi:hypothetical protein